MRILLIDEEFPFPLNTGKRLRTFNLVRVLAQRHEVSYLAYGTERSASAEYLHRHGITPISVPPRRRQKTGWRFYVRLLVNLVSRYPYIVTSHYSKAFQSRLDEQLESGCYDIVVCEWTPYAQFLRKPFPSIKVIVAHNVESAIWRRYEENEHNPLKKWYISQQARKIEVFEKTCFKWADGATAVSHEEAETLRSYGVDYAVEVVKNGVDVEFFAPQDVPIAVNAMVFTGSMDWRPNQDAVHYFVSEIFPLVRSLKPEATITIVGRNPPPEILKLERINGVSVTGTVDDVRPYIAAAAVYVVPLRIGGGSRLKILEAASMKKAIVSTTIGAEGLETEDGRDLLIMDDPNDFAMAVARCMDQPDLRTNLGESARRLVEDTYRWEVLGRTLENYLRSLMKAK